MSGIFPNQVAVSWSWFNHLIASAAAVEKRPLLINLDETSVPLTFVHTKGNVMLLDVVKQWNRNAYQGMSRHHKRSNFTHVALICDDVAIQPLLPQVIFISAALVTNEQFAAIQRELPANVYVKRMKKAWNNKAEHCVIVRLLAAILRPFTATRQPILLFDAVPLHLADEVLDELRLQSIWFLVIPVRVTWLCQPLDTHTFAKYKRFLRMNFQDGLLAADETPLIVRTVRMVVRCIRTILQGYRWDKSFANNGFGPGQEQVTTYIQKHIGGLRAHGYPPALPSLADLEDDVWPHNRAVNFALISAALPPLAGPHAAAIALAPAAPAEVARAVDAALPAPASPPPLPPPDDSPVPLAPPSPVPLNLAPVALFDLPPVASASGASSSWMPASSWPVAAAVPASPEEPESVTDEAAPLVALRLRMKKKTSESGSMKQK